MAVHSIHARLMCGSTNGESLPRVFFALVFDVFNQILTNPAVLQYGKLSDIYGRKPLLLWAYFFFGLGCVVRYATTSSPHPSRRMNLMWAFIQWCYQGHVHGDSRSGNQRHWRCWYHGNKFHHHYRYGTSTKLRWIDREIIPFWFRYCPSP